MLIKKTCLIIWLFLLLIQGQAYAESKFIKQAHDKTVIMAALKAEKPSSVPPVGVSGITVPHHMLAADLIARGVWTTQSGAYDLILLLSPDHFGRQAVPFGVTTMPLESVYGRSEAVPAIWKALRTSPTRVLDMANAASEHGVHSVLPFLHAIHPGVPIVAVTTAKSAQERDWRWMAGQLSTLLREYSEKQILIVQSTDFAHHQSVFTSARRDQETLAALANANPEAVAKLGQPQHLDSSGSQFIHVLLQKELYRAMPTVVANRNSIAYAPGHQDTTSYITAVWSSDTALGSRLRYKDQSVAYFGGDLFTGRGMTPFLYDKTAIKEIVADIRSATDGGRLFVNLEGALLPEQPAGRSVLQLSMSAEHTIKLMQHINVAGASVANNHSHDFGNEGKEFTLRALNDAGIIGMAHGKLYEFGRFSILPLTFKRSIYFDHPVIRSTDQLNWICRTEITTPLIVMVHWGDEYTRKAGRKVNFQ